MTGEINSPLQEGFFMKIGCPTWLIGTKKLSEATRFVAETGFGAVAFLNNFPGLDPNTVGSKTYEELGPTAKIIKDYGLHVHIHISPTGIMQRAKVSHKPFGEASKQEMRLICDWIKTTRQGKVVSFDPLTVEDEDRQQHLDPRMVELLQITADLLQDTEIKVGIENSIYPDIALPERIANFLLSVGRKNAGLHLDLGHVNIAIRQEWMPQKNISEYIDALTPEIVEVHLHDNDGCLDQHLLPGEGSADLLSGLKTLKKREYDGTITVESTPRDASKRKKIIQEAKVRTERLLKKVGWH